MSKEFIYKKIKQISQLISEIEIILSMSYKEFKGKFINKRAMERNFQLMVEQASDINNNILLENGQPVPETYRASFAQMENLGIFDNMLVKELIKSANLRNILIHEYDFDEDSFIFYKSVKKFIPIYKTYIKLIEEYLNKKII